MTFKNISSSGMARCGLIMVVLAGIAKLILLIFNITPPMIVEDIIRAVAYGAIGDEIIALIIYFKNKEKKK